MREGKCNWGQWFQHHHGGCYIDLRDAFLNAEDGFVYEVIIPCDDSFDRLIAVSCQELNDEWLPVAGELLDFDSEPLPALLLQKQDVK